MEEREGRGGGASKIARRIGLANRGKGYHRNTYLTRVLWAASYHMLSITINLVAARAVVKVRLGGE